MFAAGLGNGNPVAEHIWLPCCTPWGPAGFNHAGITFEKQNLITGLVLAIVLHPYFSPGEQRAGRGEKMSSGEKKESIWYFFCILLNQVWNFENNSLFVRVRSDFWFSASLHLIPVWFTLLLLFRQAICVWVLKSPASRDAAIWGGVVFPDHRDGQMRCTLD